MNRVSRTCMALSVLLILAVSCKKDTAATDTNNNNNNTNPPTVTDSSYVDRIYIVDSTAAGEDTAYHTILTYDNAKRVISIVDSVPASSPYLFTKKLFEYNGSDSLPFRSTLYIYDGNYYDTAITYFYFDNSSRLIKDSVIRSEKDQLTPLSYQVKHILTTISYSGNMIYGLTLDSTSFSNGSIQTGAANIIKDTATTDANGNMMLSINRRGNTKTVSTISYDNNPHPFKRLNIYRCYSYEFFPTFYSDPLRAVSSHNIIHILEERTGSSPYNHDITMINLYHSNDWLKSTTHPNGSNPGEYEKYVFVYKSL